MDDNKMDIEKNTESNKKAELEKLKGTISEAELKQTKLYEKIGKIIYEKYKDNPLAEVEEEIKIGLNIENIISACQVRISALQEKTKCPVCGVRLKQTMNYCYNCGEKIKEETNKKRNCIYCSKCGKRLELGSVFCTNCGKKVEI